MSIYVISMKIAMQSKESSHKATYYTENIRYNYKES